VVFLEAEGANTHEQEASPPAHHRSGRADPARTLILEVRAFDDATTACKQASKRCGSPQGTTLS
jgi:hypothetical protein